MTTGFIPTTRFRVFPKLAFLFLITLGVCTQQAHATRFVSNSGTDAANDCSNSATPCATLQWAVDSADAGEEIRVAAGTYSGSEVVRVSRFGEDFDYKQVVFIARELTLRGGYSDTDWISSDPAGNLTTIDAAGDGRAVSIVDTGDDLVILDGFTLTGGDYTGLGNQAGQVNHVCLNRENEDCGGGLYVYGSAFQLFNSVVSGNTAGTVAGDGGGIYLWQARTSKIENTTVVANDAPYGGGGLFAVYQWHPLTISDSAFESNTADRGGGINLATNIKAMVHFEDCVVSGNTASGSKGGGLYARLTDNGLLLKVQRVVVKDNEAWGQGKGMMLESAGPVIPEAQLENVLFSGNTRVDGAPEATSDAVLALGPGFTGLNVSLAHVTAASNPAGSFLYAVPTTQPDDVIQVTAANVLLSGFENGYAGEETADGELIIEHRNTLFYNVANHHLTVDGTPTFSEIDPVIGNPLLDADYRLQSGSAAIDAGTEAGVSDDIDGNHRPIDAAPDIGIDEYGSIFADGFESGG